MSMDFAVDNHIKTLRIGSQGAATVEIYMRHRGRNGRQAWKYLPFSTVATEEGKAGSQGQNKGVMNEF